MEENNVTHLEMNDTLLRLGGDTELLHELYEAFLEDTPGKMQELAQAAIQGDLDTCLKRAHSIKGASAAIGAEHCRQLAEAVECAARDDDAGKVSLLLPQLSQELGAVKEHIDKAK